MHQQPVQLCTVPRQGSIAILKTDIADLCGIMPHAVPIQTLPQHIAHTAAAVDEYLPIAAAAAVIQAALQD